MRAIGLSVLATVIVAALAVFCWHARVRALPTQKDEPLPDPPMQHAEWNAPKADVPADLVGATKLLFEQGLADPRGCEYRSISVEVGSCWGGSGAVECHGWVLPAAADPKAPRWAVCWNGLLYSTASVKDKADLDADIRAMLKSDDETRAAWARDRNGFPFHRFGSACPAEGEAVSEKRMLPSKVCMLLRLGNGELAADFWKAWVGVGDANSNKQDTYAELSEALLWANFDRAICAHMRGDDRLSLSSATAVGDLRKSVEQELTNHKIEQPQQREAYLDVVPGLVTDEQRRVAEPARTPALKLGQASFANKAAWVAALVADLDQVSARQMGQPGGVALGNDPIVEALIACGDDAVEPLLECFEHDKRLTRSVHFWRDFSPNRMPIGTPEAAYVALSGILHTTFFSAGSTGDDLTAHGEQGRAKLALAMRAYWKKYKGVPLADRWFETLADDGAGEQKWEEALSNIMRPVDVTVTPGSMFGTGWIVTPQRMPGETPKFTGESLRAKSNPSLVELVAKRIEAIDHQDHRNDNSSPDAFQVAAASKMAIELSKWDPTAAKPIVRKQLDFCVAMFGNGFFRQYGEPARPSVAGLASALARAGDHSGLKTYGDWIQTITPHDLGASPDDILSPLWKFQDDPAILATAERLFNDPKSSWNPMLPHVITGWGQQALLRSPLLGLKSFRDQMLRGLADESEYGTLTIREDRRAELKSANINQRLEIPTGEALIALVGTETKIRTADEYAHELSQCGGAPAFQFYWPQPQRDAAIKACQEFLTAFGEHLRYTNQYTFENDFSHGRASTARLTFAPLGRPATQEDANTHHAIFSLEGMGERRVFKLPSIPMKASWVTLKKYPVDQQFWSLDGKSGVNHTFLQDCWVWQAEEVKTANGWERYFGVVGPHEIDKVPASNIEFPKQYGWASLPNGLDLKIEPPRVENQGQNVTFTRLPLKSPLLVRIVIRNRRGVAQSLPTQFVTKIEGGKLAIRPGMKISLTPAPVDGAASNPRSEPPPTLVMKALPPLSPQLMNETKRLESNETFQACEFDLRDLFEINRPGRYELQISFTKESSFGEATCWPPASFELTIQAQ